MFSNEDPVTAGAALWDINEEAVTCFLWQKANADRLFATMMKWIAPYLLTHSSGVELLIGSLEPVEQRLPCRKCNGTNCHSQTSPPTRPLKRIAEAFHGGPIVSTFKGAGILHVLMTICALGGETDIVNANTCRLFQSLDEVPYLP